MPGLLTALLCLALQSPDRFVDASARAGGDGSHQKPFRSLQEALGEGARVRIAPGHYPADLTLPAGTELVGAAGVVLEAAGEGLKAAGQVSLESLQIRGGSVGLRGAGARIRLGHVRFTGQTGAALRLEGGELRADELAIDTAGWAFDLTHVETTLQGIEARGGLGSRFREGATRVSRAVFEADRGPALMISHAAATLEDVVTRHGMDGVMANDHAHLTLVRVRAEGRDTGLALVASEATLREVTARATSGDAARWLSSSVQGSLEVTGARSTGLLVNDGKASLTTLRVSNVAGPAEDDGSGLMVRRADVTVEHLSASGLSGSAAWVAEEGKLKFGELVVTGAKQPALIVETGGSAKGRSLRASGTAEPAVLVSGPARLELDSLDTALPALTTSCDASTEVHIAHGLPKPVASYCVTQ